MDDLLLRRQLMLVPNRIEPKATWTSRTWDYFRTDIIPEIGMSVEFKFSISNNTDSAVTMIGTRQLHNSDNGSYVFEIADPSNPNWKANGKKFPYRSTTIPKLSVGTHIVKGDDAGVTIDSVRYNFADYKYSTFNATYSSTAGLGVGRCSYNSGAVPSVNSLVGSFIYLKVWDSSNNLTHHLVPIPIEGYESYAQLYDLVTGVSYLPACITVSGYTQPQFILYTET